MGSALVNYYRKKDEKDDHIPKVRSLLEYLRWKLIYNSKPVRPWRSFRPRAPR